MSAYKDYCDGKQTLEALSKLYRVSISTLQRHFDELAIPEPHVVAAPEPINLLFDATFFKRTDGVLVFRANRQTLHRRFVQSETLIEIAAGFDVLDRQGHRFKSATIDGRRGVIQLIQARYPGLPIQLCVNFIKHKLLDVTRRITQGQTVALHLRH